MTEDVLIGAALFAVVGVSMKYQLNKRECVIPDASVGKATNKVVSSSTIDSLIGNTPLLKLQKLSAMTGCDIFVKVDMKPIIDTYRILKFDRNNLNDFRFRWNR